MVSGPSSDSEVGAEKMQMCIRDRAWAFASGFLAGSHAATLLSQSR